jgi:hypothetical protein
VWLEHHTAKAQNNSFGLALLELKVLLRDCYMRQFLPNSLEGLRWLTFELQSHFVPGALEIVLLVSDSRPHLLLFGLVDGRVEVLVSLNSFLLLTNKLPLHWLRFDLISEFVHHAFQLLNAILQILFGLVEW